MISVLSAAIGLMLSFGSMYLWISVASKIASLFAIYYFFVDIKYRLRNDKSARIITAISAPCLLVIALLINGAMKQRSFL